MSGKNVVAFINRNIVFITGGSLIIGIHWGWWRMQQNPNLVEPKDRRDLPIYSMYKRLETKMFGGNSSTSSASTEQNETLKD